MDWREESRAVIEDIRKDVKEIAVSDKLPVGDNGIYLNLTTLDGDRRCILMSTAGFEIAGQDYDQIDNPADEPVSYETPYALLSAISQLYTTSFANRLCAAMMKIKE